MAQMYFYDNQIRRFLLQFIRAFSNFQVEYGKDRDGNTTLVTVPVKYGDSSRVVSSILKGNSENAIIPTPMISCHITQLEYSTDRRQDPTFVDKRHIRMRKFDTNSGEYTTQQGNAYTVERLMPVPFNMTVAVDIWTSNTQQKLQLLEQILVLFNPALEIQSTDNYLDWGSLSYIELTGTTWSSRTVPAGIDDGIDIATLTFAVPIWISPPAKVKKLGVVQRIVASIYDETGSISDGVIDRDMLLGTRMKFTPMNYGILLLGNTITILQRQESVTNKVEPTSIENDPPVKIGADDITWRAAINQYGELQNGISQIRIDFGTGEIVGTIAYHPSDDTKLLFTVDADTIPTNDLPAVDKIINPQRVGPGAGLSAAAIGQRYLILKPIANVSTNTDGPDAWKDINGNDFVAAANDIIEYDGVRWKIAFDSSGDQGVHYLTNTNTGIQYKWTGDTWIKSYEGEYKAGDWSMVI
jgi:hypothetical protein